MGMHPVAPAIADEDPVQIAIPSPSSDRLGVYLKPATDLFNGEPRFVHAAPDRSLIILALFDVVYCCIGPEAKGLYRWPRPCHQLANVHVCRMVMGRESFQLELEWSPQAN